MSVSSSAASIPCEALKPREVGPAIGIWRLHRRRHGSLRQLRIDRAPGGKETGVKGVTFFDVGNAWDEDEDYFSDWRYSVGAGIRWLSPLGPLRLEWGYNLDPYEWEDNSRLDFMIGRFF